MLLKVRSKKFTYVEGTVVTVALVVRDVGEQKERASLVVYVSLAFWLDVSIRRQVSHSGSQIAWPAASV